MAGAVIARSSRTAPITAIVTAYDRVPQVVETLCHLRSCEPSPAEVLVHVDGDRQQCAREVRNSGLADEVVVSCHRVGPGGGRNRLIAAARYPIVASFDDDSWPIDADYFQRLSVLFERHLDAAVIGASIFHRHDARREAQDRAEWRADFVGAGCAYRREVFLATGGYVPLATAYGMEEVDLSIRLHAQGQRILHSEWLRVEHDTDLAHHGSAEVTAASVANVALLAFLRYPVSLWSIGLLQELNRVWWLIRHGRRRGVMRGLASIPGQAYAHRRLRSPLPARVVRSFLALRQDRHPAWPVPAVLSRS